MPEQRLAAPRTAYLPTPEHGEEQTRWRDYARHHSGVTANVIEGEEHEAVPVGASDAATFERFRAFAEQAVTQLVQEMAEKRSGYPMRQDADDVLALVKHVATVQGLSPWLVWETWALRHAVVVHQLVPTDASQAVNTAAMRKRLMDLLGYCVLGLLLADEA